jgi:hypothetical protein
MGGLAEMQTPTRPKLFIRWTSARGAELPRKRCNLTTINRTEIGEYPCHTYFIHRDHSWLSRISQGVTSRSHKIVYFDIGAARRSSTFHREKSPNNNSAAIFAHTIRSGVYLTDPYQQVLMITYAFAT